MNLRPLLLAVTVLLTTAIAAFAQPTSNSATLPNVTLTPSEIIPLWPTTPPDESAPLSPEHVLPDRPRPFDQITNVSVPTLSVFLPPANQRTGTAVLVIPGGGLERLALEHEGYEVAEWLNAQGLAAFLLKYRVPPRDPEKRWRAGLQDAQRAMSLIRARAADWHIDPSAIGTIGFSAGAEINVLLSTYHKSGDRQYPRIDSADDVSTRPDFNLAIYGGGFANVRTNSLRDDITARLDASTPPMFVVHAFDDYAQSSLILLQALKRANIPSELHVFAAGAHGFGVRESGLPVAKWRDLALDWLRWQGFLDTPAVRDYASTFFRAFDSRAASLPRFSVTPHSTLPDAFAAQRRIVRTELARGAEIAGYKGAFASAAAQQSAHLDGPLHGVLFKSGRIDATSSTPTVVPLEPNRPLYIETELGFIIATDIGAQLTTPRQALTTIEAVVPVIELPVNLAAITEGAFAPADLVAGNGGSDRYLVGPAVSPQELGDLDALPITLRRGDELLHESTGGIVARGTAQHLMTLINQIIAQGRILHRGDLILTGALPRPHPSQPGHYTADFGPLGRIDFELR